MDGRDVSIPFGQPALQGGTFGAPSGEPLLQLPDLQLETRPGFLRQVQLEPKLLQPDLQAGNVFQGRNGFRFRRCLRFGHFAFRSITAASGGSLISTIAVRYDSSETGFRFVEEARSLWAYRHLVRELVVRDLKVRYKRSVLGVAWTMLSPLLTMASLAFAFSFLMRQQIHNYPVFYLAGSLFWTFFSQATGHAANLTVEALEIAKRIHVPHSAFVASAVTGAAFNLALSLVPFFLIAVITGFPIHATWLFLPVAVAIGACFTAGVALLIFTLASRFGDVRETYLVLLGPWFFMTPIAYTRDILPGKFQIIVRYNPMTYLVELFRAPLYDGWLPGQNTLLFAVLSAGASLAIGWYFYSSRIDDYAARS